MLKKQRIAVTGGSGFIGRILLEQLIKDGHSVRVLDSSGSSYPSAVTLIKGDLLTGIGLDLFLKGSDVVIHLAGQVLPGKTTMDTGNFKTTKNLIVKMQENDVKKIIFASTVAVYGSSKTKKFHEEDECIPDTEYGVSKLKAENLIKSWSKNYGNKYTILRFFSIYGPTNTKGIIYNVCYDVLRKKIATVYGDGLQERDFVYVNDAVTAISLFLNHRYYGIYNIGTGKYYSIQNIISFLDKIIGEKIRIDFKEEDKTKVSNIIYSVEKLKQTTGWLPEVNIEEGLRIVYRSLSKSER